MDIEELKTLAKKLRLELIESLYKAQSGHPGSALSAMDVMVALYFGGVMKHDPDQPDDLNNDEFILSNGHACPGWYAVLAEAGYFDKELLQGLRDLGSPLQGHPHRGAVSGVNFSSGSLGQGLSCGIGLAYANVLAKRGGRVFVMMSDGEQEEGSTWEAVMHAPKLKLDNLVAIVDKNKYQIDGATAEIMPGLDPLAEKYRAFNWQVQEIDGHDFAEIIEGLRAAVTEPGPAVIISHTVRGKGVSFMEGSLHWHAGAITKEQYQQARGELR